MKKIKFTCGILILMIFLVFGKAQKVSAAEEDSGSCGDSLSWTLDTEGNLTISGTGEMDNYNGAPLFAPWYGSYRDKIKNIVIEEGATSVGDYAFYYCDNASSVTLPDSVTVIGDCAFADCSSLTDITLPNSLSYIGTYGFRRCYGLSSVFIPDTVNEMGHSVFYGCQALENVHISAGLMNLPRYTFEHCDKLYLVELPDGMASIGDGAFDSCQSLTSLNIPETVTYIDNYAFSNCLNLTQMEFFGSAPVLHDNIFMDDTLTAYYPGGDDTWTEDVRQNYGGVSVNWVARAQIKPMTSITLSENKITLKYGETKALGVSFTPEDTTDDKSVLWTSSDSNIASVDDTGIVRGEKEGVAVITASCGSFSAKCIVSVTAPDVTNISLSKVNVTINSGSKCTLVVSYLPAGAKAKTTWTSNDTQVVSVSSNGVITAGTPGTTTIKVSCAGITRSCTVKVKARLTGIAISPSSMSLQTGGSKSIAVTLLPSYTTDAAVVNYTSEDTSVAVVDANGKVTALSSGSTRIIIQAGSRKKICRVDVT